MELRTFLAKDMRDALATVRAEMGNDAVIVGSQKTKDGGVMVRAACDLPDQNCGTAEEPSAEAQTHDASAALKDALREGMIGNSRGGQPKFASEKRFSRAEVLALLRTHRAPDSVAHDLAKTAEQSGLFDMALALACALDRRMKTAPIDIAQTTALLLVGPNGAGKTAVAAKLAAHARLGLRAVKLIATDVASAGAVARLETFAMHIDVPFAVAENAEALAKLVAECRKEDVTAIIDTAGFDPRYGKARAAFSALAKIEGIEAVAVVPATGDAEEISEIIGALATLGALRVIVTGTDLIRRMGTLAVAATGGLPLAHVTRSPYVAAGLETITPLSLARALIATDRNPDQGSTH